MSILDDLEKLSKLDKQDMLGVVEKFTGQLVEAKSIAGSSRISSLKSGDFKGIAILGMGGSGFTGDIIKSLIIEIINIPVINLKGYNIPSYINRDWLVIAVSYSGNTEETISALMQAIRKNCHILCISSGGKVEEIARQGKYSYATVPGGFQPRGASGYLILTTYLLLQRIGIIDIAEEEIDEALELLVKKSVEYSRDTVTEENFAKKLAFELINYFPVIYGMEGYLSAVAYRWKCQINENAKCPCFWNEFPELNHNETVGWYNLKDITERFILLIFNDRESSDRLKVRTKTTRELVKENFGKVIEIPVEGRSKLARALSTIFLGDMMSVYLAFLYGTDPTPIERISVLKSELSKLGG